MTGAPRPPCCPPPFDVANNWMHEYPKAYVIPFGGASGATLRRTASSSGYSSTGSACGSSRRTRPSGARVRRGARTSCIMNQAPAASPTPRSGIGVDVSELDQPALRAARRLEPRLPLGRRHRRDPDGASLRGEDERDRKPNASTAASAAGRTRSRRHRPLRPRDRLADRGADAERAAQRTASPAQLATACVTARRGDVPGRDGRVRGDEATRRAGRGGQGQRDHVRPRCPDELAGRARGDRRRRESRCSPARSTRTSGRSGTSASRPIRVDARRLNTRRDRSARSNYDVVFNTGT